MGPSGVPFALARVPGSSNCANARSRWFQVVPFALKRAIINFKKLIQIDGAIGADDLHLAHDIPYALGSVRCVV